MQSPKTLLFVSFSTSVLLVACSGDAPACPSGATWDSAARRCVCEDESLVTHPTTFRCVSPGSLDGGPAPERDGGARDAGMHDAAVSDDDASIELDGGVDLDGALDAGDLCAACVAPPAHGSATCEEGVCGVSCDEGLEPVTVGPEDARELRCSAFGGAYVRRLDGTCVDANPLTGDCGCGAFDALEIDWRIDTANPRAIGKLGLCEIAADGASSSYGGAYVVEEEPRSTCVRAHAATGRCECPAGFETTRGWVGRNDIDRLTRVVFCLAGEAEAGATLAAAFTELRCGDETTCASGDSCACPEGTSALPVVSGVGRGSSEECVTRSAVCVADPR